MKPKIAATLALGMLLGATFAHAEDPSADAGRGLAEANCATCHALEAEGASPLAAAPPFRDVAARYTQDELMDGLMEGLPVRHEAMPDWDMSEDQAIALSLYIMTLAK